MFCFRISKYICNSRSRSGRRSPGENVDMPMEFAASPSLSVEAPFSRYMTSPKPATTPPAKPVTTDVVMATFPSTSPTVQVFSGQYSPAANTSRNGASDLLLSSSETSCDTDALVASFVESLISAMKPHSSVGSMDSMRSGPPSPTKQPTMSLPIYTQGSSADVVMTISDITPTTQFTPVQATTSAQAWSSSKPKNNRPSLLTQILTSPLDSQIRVQPSAFVPLNKSLVIQGGAIQMPITTMSTVTINSSYHTNHAVTTSQTFIPMETTNSVFAIDSYKDNECEVQPVQSYQITQDPLVGGASSSLRPVAPSNAQTVPNMPVSMELMQDEDSLLNMLEMDVLDVNSVMSFFNDDHSQTSS